MATFAKVLEIRTSPHVQSGASVPRIMWGVVLSLLPACGYAVLVFGVNALVTLTTAVIACFIAEHLLCRLSDRPTTVRDGSVAITGLLYGMTLPPALPMWMVVVGAFVSVGIGKFLFGGLGANPFNPALVGRAFLQSAFPASMTTWSAKSLAISVNGGNWDVHFSWDVFSRLSSSVTTFPFARPVYVDATTAATPLGAWSSTPLTDLVVGTTTGSLGETSAVLLLLGGAYLIFKNYMNWRIPASTLLAVFVLSGAMYLVDSAAYPSPWFMLFSGGLMLGAMYMATDMVASPMTPLGVVLYGGLIGILTVVIRLWGGMPEGVMYAILLANAVGPHIDQIIQPQIYGAVRSKPGDAS